MPFAKTVVLEVEHGHLEFQSRRQGFFTRRIDDSFLKVDFFLGDDPAVCLKELPCSRTETASWIQSNHIARICVILSGRIAMLHSVLKVFSQAKVQHQLRYFAS